MAFASHGAGIGTRSLLNSISMYTAATTTIPSNDVTNVILDSDEKNIWYMTQDRICKYNGIIWTHENYLTLGNSTTCCDEMVLTRNGTIWCSTERGVHMIDGGHNPFTADDTPMLANRVFGIVDDSQGNVLCATLGGITRYDGTKWFDYTGKRFALLQNKVITGIGIDNQDNKWVATLDDGIIVFGPTKK